MLTRRTFVRNTPAAAIAAMQRLRRGGQGKTYDRTPARITALEREIGGRIGVCIFDTATNTAAGYRVDERFPMCSTFKFPLAAAILKGVDDGTLRLDRTVEVPAKPLLSHSPITEAHAGGTLSLRDLCAAVLIHSDNTAANLLLEVLGGPPRVTAFLRLIGDTETQLDRNEPTVNSSTPGDPRDTTTPHAMAMNLNRILLEKVLRPPSREEITEWMEDCVTGVERLRRNMPEGWRAADRTGSSGEGTTNDIAVLWPRNRLPVIVTAYITQCPGPEGKRGDAIAEIGRYVREAILFG